MPFFYRNFPRFEVPDEYIGACTGIFDNTWQKKAGDLIIATAPLIKNVFTWQYQIIGSARDCNGDYRSNGIFQTKGLQSIEVFDPHIVADYPTFEKLFLKIEELDYKNYLLIHSFGQYLDPMNFYDGFDPQLFGFAFDTLDHVKLLEKICASCQKA